MAYSFIVKLNFGWYRVLASVHIGFQVVALYINGLSEKFIPESNIKASLVRAVLEVGEPANERFGQELFKQRKKHYWLRLALYKFKVVITNAIAKILFRKLLGRVGMRSYAPLISVLMVGAWDAWVQSSVFREVRFRMASRLFVIEKIEWVKKDSPEENFLESLISFIVLRILMMEKHDVNLTLFIVQIENYFGLSESKYSELYDMDYFKTVYLSLSDAQKKEFSELACGLFCFKHKRWSSDEAHLISI